ncbi:MAG: PqqD family protein [Roseofilum sp. SBFL]|uniref:PqqD family protein n=1 Tax=unclassified Roseofilum TaxID=2620099 RepID=UPI001B033DEF|nr:MULTISPECIES: PqqD family protein [unclassified Roseofilum]MBP0014558.1 PqqD family protein [Roseofilum sp. SID3]MBP0026089.1 PqqD family protein [Roseofilum sp. SID2]MBP0038254.1 PqqD family protein [Roseofilum sp. SID1]MBP0044313.1 PqqD family protein [Roseofilum sp. SBFL]
MEISISNQQNITLAPEVLVQELSGESVLLNLNSEEYFGLDEVGSRMLSLLTGSASIQEASDRLLEEYEVEPEKLHQDLIELIENMVDHDLVTVSPV